MTQPTLTDLAQRGAPCKPWAEWCDLMLYRETMAPSSAPAKLFIDSPLGSSAYRLSCDFLKEIGPLPSCTYLDDQLGEFLEKAGVFVSDTEGYGYSFQIGLEIELPETDDIRLLNQLEAAIIIIERAHCLGEYAHYTESEAAPYMAAFLRGIGG